MLDFNIPEMSSREKIIKSGLPVVIYGMGNGADKVIDNFSELGIPVLGVTASDDFVRGQNFRGFTVKKLSNFSGDFIVCPAFGTSRKKVIKKIVQISEKYRVIFPVVPVFGNEIVDRDFVSRFNVELNESYNLFDDFSKRVFEGCFSFIYGGELKELLSVETSKKEVFENVLKLGPDESYLDLGAYRGDTIDEFLEYSMGEYSKIVAIEPDVKNYRKLMDKYGGYINFEAFNTAVYSSSGEVLFSDFAGRQSSISDEGAKKKCVDVDSLSDSADFTYIKADVEGAEAEMIKGAIETLKMIKPKLNIALYHRSRDIFEIPLMINKINSDYVFHLRKHPYIPCWDMNLYCV